MREENIKEQLSRYAFCLLASRAGCKIRNFNFDDGVDLGFEKLITHIMNGDSWTISIGKPVDVQLKATTESQVVRQEKFLSYDLRLKNYNDLIARKKLKEEGETSTPLILALLVLPDNPDAWLRVDAKGAENILLNGVFHWYLPPVSEFSKNKNWQRISIPLENVIDLSFFENVPNLLFLKKG